MVVNDFACVYLNIKNMTDTIVYTYCSSRDRDETTGLLYTAFLVLPEVVFSGLITRSSCSMISFLHRHKQQLQHMHCSHVQQKISPESKATQSTLLLVSSFISFYALSSILQGCIAFLCDPSWWLVNTAAVISMCFPTLGPFVLSRDSCVPSFCFYCIRNKKSYCLTQVCKIYGFCASYKFVGCHQLCNIDRIVYRWSLLCSKVNPKSPWFFILFIKTEQSRMKQVLPWITCALFTEIWSDF